MNTKISYLTRHKTFKTDDDFFSLIQNLKIKNRDFPNKNAQDFVNLFSKSILLDKASRAFPELIVLANFFKRRKIFNTYSNTSSPLDDENTIYTPLGKTFHIAPSNVDTIFLYSSLIALMCGNICIIRVSSRQTTQLEFAINKLILALKEYQSIQEKFFLISYDHNSEITEKISQLIDCRIVWGGDDSVKEIRSIPLNPLAREIVFPNRFSSTIIKSKKLLENQNNLENLVKGFVNDTIFFNQQACSSPKLVMWLGSNDDNLSAKTIFWKEYKDYFSQSFSTDTSGMMMDRFVASSFYTSSNLAIKERQSVSFPTRLSIINQESKSIRQAHPGNGLFLEIENNEIDEISSNIRDIDQTLSYFGLTKEEIFTLLDKVKNRGIDRVVPVGQSLDFSVVWDGYDLIEQFSRKIVVT